MPITPCDPCDCISPNIGNDKFKQDVEILLCDTLTALGYSFTPGNCDPCSCISGNISNLKFKQDVEILLCALISAVGGGGSGDVVGPAVAVSNNIVTFDGITGKLIKDSGIGITVPLVMAVGITIDGGGSAITTGVKGYISIPYACTINNVTLLADQSGSAVVDIWKDTYANYPPVVGDTITAAAKPTISAAIKSQDTTLTGWTTSISAGDILGFNVDSASTITRLQLILKVTKT